jgi:hypothetical protein
MDMKDINPGGTHLPLLMRAIINTTGPVLELGVGWNSTPVLHEACSGRLLVSVENEPQWAENFRFLETPQHRIVYDCGWAQVASIIGS